jgi:hypothetical protein
MQKSPKYRWYIHHDSPLDALHTAPYTEFVHQAFELQRRPIYRAEKPVRDPRFLAMVRKLCCIVCGSYRLVEAAHFGAHGMGQKSSDHDALPLCLKHHRTGPLSYHTLGARRFITFHNLDVRKHQERIQKFYREKIAA